MPKLIDIRFLLPLLYLLTGVLAFGESEPEEDDPNDPVLPLEEAMAEIDRIAPLPTIDADEVKEPLSLVLLNDIEPDYTYLRYLQIQERIAEREALEAANTKLIHENFLTDQRSPEICDPLKLLRHSEFLVLQDTVTAYSEDAYTPVFVNILSNDQFRLLMSIPHEKHESVLEEHPNGVLVYYFYEEPTKTKVYFGKKAFDDIPYEKQKEFIAAAEKSATTQKDGFNSIYRHLTSLTGDLTKINDGRSRSLTSAKASDGINNAGTTHQLNPISKKGKFNPVTAALLLIFCVLIICIILLIKQLNPRKNHRFPVGQHAPILNFKTAKDTSQAIQFQTNKK